MLPRSTGTDPISTKRPAENHQAKPSKACQGCRSSKVRCVQPDHEQPCLRCRRQGRTCLPIEESNKRQKRDGSRSISEIETRLAALTDHLQRKGADASALIYESTAERASHPTATATLDAEETPDYLSSTSHEHSVVQIEATIGRAIDDETANMVFDRFTTNVLPTFPFMVLPVDNVIADTRKNNPILFLAILDAAGDGFWNIEVSRQLRKLFMQVYSTVLRETAVYSMSTLQALIISAIWYRDVEAEEIGEQMDVFWISNAAANMAIGIGLGDILKEYSWSGFMPMQSSSVRGPASDYQIASLEVRRAWLACYYVCSHTSMAMQTPGIIRWTRQMEECLEVLEIHPASPGSDKILCSHVRLQHILEDVEGQLRSSILGPTAMKVTYRAFRRQLADWASSIDIWNEPLQLAHPFATLYLHEMAMCAGSPPINQAQFIDCTTTAHHLLDTFLSLDISSIRTLPTSYSIRLIHATIVLIKLHFAATRLTDPADMVPKTQSIQMNHYLARLMQKFSGWRTLWPMQRLANKLRELKEMVRHCDNNAMPSELAWLNVWTLEEAPLDTNPHDTTLAEQQQDPEQAHSTEIGETAILSVPNGDDLIWQSLDTNANVSQYDLNNTLPSASLDIAQLNDWFGTDLNTSTFDFDGNLQSMIQFFD
ncbi:hypothetical protein M438DRAFT_19313 [Aureobasidium pullulans EXF-150]|uniref:Zn(2)-C6 fungal-type domain-containing protein n=1 Tax=Aureobasidium pullulans EXF-150 TaxID=1043002 RepID=A0A074Y769_AURPU|nr:uncharacterized protein M438DRAFT_19313 [Aureobasidium pullulans EXF-150]KEQ90067.1 hypothetical protein M438DRAFT_19313 [Aureobasidium pullulans EXF-150]